MQCCLARVVQEFVYVCVRIFRRIWSVETEQDIMESTTRGARARSGTR